MQVPYAELAKLGGSCREYTLLRDDTSSQVKGWIRGNTKTGIVLDAAVSYHLDRHGVEIMIIPLFGDGTLSWVRIVTEMSEETHIEDIGESTVKPVAMARPKQTPSSMLFSTTVSVPYHERKWIDVEPGRFNKSCLEVSKLMIRFAAT